MNIMEEIKKAITNIEKDISEMKVDLRHHIKRSDKHEKWLMTMIIGASMTAGLGARFLIPYLMKFL
jgi:hypothetical protein